MEAKTEIKKVFILEYAEYPGPRYCDQGEYSGEEFYHNILNPAFANAVLNNEKLSIDLDGTAGYASSFLDEAFGNLVFDFSQELVKNKLEIISDQEPDWKEMIFSEVLNDWEQRRIDNQVPKKTIRHEEWYRIDVSGKLVKKRWL